MPDCLAPLICGKVEHHSRKGTVKQTCLPMATRKQKEREKWAGRGEISKPSTQPTSSNQVPLDYETH